MNNPQKNEKKTSSIKTLVKNRELGSTTFSQAQLPSYKKVKSKQNQSSKNSNYGNNIKTLLLDDGFSCLQKRIR